MVRCRLLVAAITLVLLCSTAAATSPTFYGYIKLDASIDSAKTNDGNFAYVVLPYEEGKEDNEFNMTAKQTRLGVKFVASDEADVDVSGRVEFDFYGGGAENKPNPMLRHAFLEMDFHAFQVLAGQTSDIISPLNPTTLNYIVLWKSGNIGYRRPQIRLSKSMRLGDDGEMAAALSANRNLGRDEDGEDTGSPSVQGRVAVSTELFGDSAVLGVSGVYGQETDLLGNEFKRTGLAVDVALPLGEMLHLKGEYFQGKNLAVHLGGVGQGIGTEVMEEEPVREATEPRMSEIEASGWWAQLSFHPMKAMAINVGAGMDDPELPDYETVQTIESNATYYGNVIWNVTPSAYAGLEYMRLETEYADAEGETEVYEDNRVQLSLGYKF